jgi:hypothetical protein
MRTVLHILAVFLALPQVLLCALFLAIGHVTGGRTLGSLLVRVVDAAYVLFTWGGLVAIVAFAVVLGAGFSARWRRVAAGVVALVVLATTVMLGRVGGGDPWLFLPGVLAFGICLLNLPKAVTLPAVQKPGGENV